MHPYLSSPLFMSHFFVWCEVMCPFFSWFFGRIPDLYPYHHYDYVIGSCVYGS